jgi:hypothetical protein
MGEAKRRRAAAGSGLAYKDAARDRAVQRLLDRAKRGEAPAFAEYEKACPFRMLLALGPSGRPTYYAAQLGFGPIEEFSIATRSELAARLARGETIELLSNRTDILQHVARVLVLAAAPPAGQA